MWRILFLISCMTVVSVTSTTKCHDCIKVDGVCHRVNFLLNLTSPFRKEIVIKKMGILRSENILFYSYEPRIEDPEYYKVAYVSLDDHNKNGSLADSTNKQYNFGTFDFDQENNLIYLGGSNGIYYTRNNNHNITWFSSLGDNIISLFYKGKVYFVPDSENKIMKKEKNNFEVHLEQRGVKNFVINDKWITVYLSASGLFATNKVDTAMLSINNFYRGITLDLNDNVYAWWVDGIYKVELNSLNISDSFLRKVADIPYMGALTFDNNNNMLITYQEGLFRLEKTVNMQC